MNEDCPVSEEGPYLNDCVCERQTDRNSPQGERQMEKGCGWDAKDQGQPFPGRKSKVGRREESDKCISDWDQNGSRGPQSD